MINDNIDLNIKTIYKIINWIRTMFAHYLKDLYKLDRIGNTRGCSIIETCEIRLDIFTQHRKFENFYL